MSRQLLSFSPAFLRRRAANPLAAYAAGGVSPAFVIDPVEAFYASGGAVAENLSDVATFARASAQRYRNSSGLLASVTTGDPALGHYIWNGSAFVNAGLLMEPAIAANYVTAPEDFANGFWTKVNVGSNAVDATGPDGSTSATSLIANSSGGETAVYVGANVSGFATSALHTWSFFAHEDTMAWALTYLTSFTTPATGGWFVDLANFATGSALDSTTGMSIYVERFGGGWVRVHITLTTHSSDTSAQPRVYIAEADSDFNVPRDGTSSIKLFGAQFSAGPPSGYIGTTARAAATLTMAAADLPYSGTGMSGKFDGTFTVGAQTLFDWRVDANNRVTLTVDASGNFTLTMVNGGSSASVTTTDAVPLGIHEEGTVAWYVSGSSIGISLDGATADEQATAIGIPDLSSADATAGGNGTIAELTLWDSNLAASGIEEASATGFFI